MRCYSCIHNQRYISSHVEGFQSCDRNDVQIPSPRSFTQHVTLATASCLSYKASIGPISSPCSWHYGLLANSRSDLRCAFARHVNFLLCTHDDASPTSSRQATTDTTHIFRLERVLKPSSSQCLRFSPKCEYMYLDTPWTKVWYMKMLLSLSVLSF